MTVSESRVWHLIQITDCHLAETIGPVIRGVDPDATLALVTEIIKTYRPDYCLATGDLSDDGSVESYERLADHLRTLDLPVACLPGNHDDPGVMLRVLPGGNIGMPEAIELRDWQIILLDSTVPGRCSGHLSDVSLSGLSARLHIDLERHRLIALHHPVLPNGCAWLDSEMTLDNPDALHDVIRRFASVRGLIWGHIHQDFHEQAHGLPCWGTPATSVQFQPGSRALRIDERSPGFRHLWLHPDGRIVSRVERLWEGKWRR